MRTLFAALVVCLAAICTPVRAASVLEWRTDIDRMVLDVLAHHPAPFERVGRLDFLRQADRLKRDLPILSEEERVVGAMRLIGRIGDSHTTLEVLRPDFALWYPVRLYEFDDGYFISAAHRSVIDLAGAQVLEVAGRPVREAAEAARDLMGADNDFARKENLSAFSNAALMRGLGFAGPEHGLKIKVRLVSGKVVERTLTPTRSDDPRFAKDDSSFEWRFQPHFAGPPFGGVDNWISSYRGLTYGDLRKADPARPLRLVNPRFFTAQHVPEHDAFYIQANTVQADFTRNFQQALAEVDRLKPRRLIVDLRYAFGGDGSQVPAVAREFARREGSGAWRELYILTGRRTLSAGIMAAVGIAEVADHTFVGEPMAAPMNSYGDATGISYAATGLRLNVSTVRHQLGEPRDIAPLPPVDIPATFTSADYAAGRDPAVDAILRGDEMRGLAMIGLTDGGAAARRAYAERKVRFARYPWWTPPSEFELRKVGQRLVEEKRFDDAIEVAILNTEIHPDIWNTWYNLGNAQKAAGRDADALKSWREVLRLDPGNGNAAMIRKALTDAGMPLE